jgi:hypothetical protein
MGLADQVGQVAGQVVLRQVGRAGPAQRFAIEGVADGDRGRHESAPAPQVKPSWSTSAPLPVRPAAEARAAVCRGGRAPAFLFSVFAHGAAPWRAMPSPLCAYCQFAAITGASAS